jgi:hypothetical protein
MCGESMLNIDYSPDEEKKKKKKKKKKKNIGTAHLDRCTKQSRYFLTAIIRIYNL